MGAASGVQSEYKLYKSRWLALGLYCLANVINAALWETFVPISDLSSSFFFGNEDHKVAVNFIALLYQILYLPGTLLASYLVSRGDLRSPIVFGSLSTALGASVKLLGVVLWGGCEASYYAVLAGQAMCAMGQPMFVNTPGLLAANWFGLTERDLATTIATLFAVIGCAVGQMMPPAFVSPNVDEPTRPHGMVDLLFCQAGLSVVFALGCFFGFKSNPPTPPSSSTERRDKGRERQGSMEDFSSSEASEPLTREEAELPRNIMHDMLHILKDANFRVLFFCFGFGLALFNTLLSIVNNLLRPCGYSDGETANFAGVLIASGIVGSGFAGWAMDRYHIYRPLLKGGFLISAFLCCTLSYFARRDSTTALYTTFAALGFFMIPMLPVAIENSIECTYPVSEELGTGILFAAGNTIGIPVTLLVLYLIEEGGEDACGTWFSPANTFVMLVSIACSLSSLLYFGPYRRLIADGGMVDDVDKIGSATYKNIVVDDNEGVA